MLKLKQRNEIHNMAKIKGQNFPLQNWFNTLNAALESENLLDAWDSIGFRPINYNQTFSWTWDDGSRYGHYISIYRDTDLGYERPVHYAR